MRYWDTLAVFEREGYDIVVDKSYEDVDPRDLFDDSVTDIQEICHNIEVGLMDWFVLRVRVLVEGHEIGSASCGGCLYENANQVLTDGMAEDLIGAAISEAKTQVHQLYKRFQELSFDVDAQAVC